MWDIPLNLSHLNELFLFVCIKCYFVIILYISHKFIQVNCHFSQGLNAYLSCFNWKQLALTYLKIYKCHYFVSRCTLVLFGKEKKNYLNVIIKLRPNHGFKDNSGTKWTFGLTIHSYNRSLRFVFMIIECKEFYL